MLRPFSLLLILAGITLATAAYSSSEDNDSWEEPLWVRIKRHGYGGTKSSPRYTGKVYLSPQELNQISGGGGGGGGNYGSGAASGGPISRGYSPRPKSYAGKGQQKAPAQSYAGGSPGGSPGESYGGGSAEGSYSPGPASQYTYAPRRANSPLYGGIHGPQTDEEALKFDSHLTRSMIADVIASSTGRKLYPGHGGVIQAAIQSRRNVQFYDVPSARDAGEPLTIEVGSSPVSQLKLRFKSASSPLAVEQDHESLPGSVRETSSEEEPHRLIHTVSRPIYQEVHEVIKPFRRVTQEIQPVQEDIQTIVAKGDEVQGVQAGSVQLEEGAETPTAVIQGSSGAPVSAPTSGPYGASGQRAGGLVPSKPSYGPGYGPAKPTGYSGPVQQKEIQVPVQQVQIPYARRAAARRARARA